MKKLKKIAILAVIIVMAVTMLTSCVSMQEKIEELSGTWSVKELDTAEQAREILENIDFYEEEIEIADLDSLYDVHFVTFDTEKNYSFVYDVDGTKECVREFLIGVFADMYENRASLNEVYSTEFDQMSEDEFYQYYMDMYSADSFENLIDKLTESTYDFESLAEPWETGTYTISGDKIMCTITGETEAESIGYEIEGDTLTLTFADVVRDYTRV